MWRSLPVRWAVICGVDLSLTVWQSDNGTEFIGFWNQKHKKTLYQQIVQQMHSETIRVPVGRKTYNSDVEIEILSESNPANVEDISLRC